MRQSEIREYLKINFPYYYDEYLSLLNNSEKIVISVLGEVSRGKSTFLNALVFKAPILEFRGGETTANIFRLEYKENFDINSQKEIVKNINLNAIENLNNINEFEKLLYFNNEEFKDVIFLDTPGFNTENEDIKMQEMIDYSVSRSDIVVFVLDVTKGITEKEIEELRNLNDNGIYDIFLILNKKDMLYDGFKNREEIKNELQHLAKQIKSILNENNIKVYKSLFPISSKKALVGFFKNDEDIIIKSNILNFTKKLNKNFEKIKEKKEKKLNSYEFLVREHKNRKRKYEKKILGYKKEIRKFINEINEISFDEIISALETKIKSFPYYFEYPTTFFVNFDSEVFYEALKNLKELLEPYNNYYSYYLKNSKILIDWYKELQDYFDEEYKNINELLSMDDFELSFTITEDIDLDIYRDILNQIGFELSTMRLNILTLDPYFIKFCISQILFYLPLLVEELEIFYEEEKKKGWLDAQEQYALPKLKEIYNLNMKTFESIKLEIKNLSKNIKEIENELQKC